MQPIDQLATRKCSKCQHTKELLAFVGGREMCRACWLDLPACDKPQYIINEKYLNTRKKRLLVKLRLNVKIL